VGAPAVKSGRSTIADSNRLKEDRIHVCAAQLIQSVDSSVQSLTDTGKQAKPWERAGSKDHILTSKTIRYQARLKCSNTDSVETENILIVLRNI